MSDVKIQWQSSFPAAIAGAYASLYKTYGKTVDIQKVHDMAVSINRETRPGGCLHTLKIMGSEWKTRTAAILTVSKEDGT